MQPLHSSAVPCRAELALPLFQTGDYRDKELLASPTLPPGHRPLQDDDAASGRVPWGLLVCTGKVGGDSGLDEFTVTDCQALREWSLLYQAVLLQIGARNRTRAQA